MMKRFVFLFCAVLLVLGGVSCKEYLDELMEMDDSETSVDGKELKAPMYILSVHEIVKYPKATELERQVESFSGRPIYVNTNSFLHSRHIEKIELKPNKKDKDYFDLILHLDRRGFMLWSMFSVQFKGRPMALLIDGVCYKQFVAKTPAVAAMDPDDVPPIVEIEGPIDPMTASRLQKWSEKNYKHYHKND